ncbi:hypothetical protein SAMN05428957_104118 [Oryzisolibacter propanilivorax]|uniref:Uncharacterized protein n=1 Tax=Oryzisolibacter propanilivorax TaxID=1527607 RepID=A0A1G9S5Y4_9BURK|nr:hypothetical protein [Oryzisolibacter propanilivorax]SDM30710.1 hypothetical protein SAMN05428957_104118 [Oryzisolibacter propanilivorax]
MRNRTFPGLRQHQLVLSLTPECLHLLHLQRGPLGWRRRHDAQRALPAGDASLASVHEHLQQCVQQWRLPSGTRVHWVLSGDILGIAAPAQPGTPATALLPFAPSDVRTQPDLFARGAAGGVLWIHKDWLAEIERISEQCRLELVELYARGQLFQREAARAAGGLKVVIEELATPQPQTFLHMYSASGGLLRSRVLMSADQGEALPGVVSAELAALQPPADSPATLLMARQPQPDIAGLRWQALQATGEGERLWQLWGSDSEGIAIRATHEELAGTLKALSLGLGLAGMLALGAVIWHDGQLRQQIEEDSTAVRRDASRVAAARALKTLTLRMSDADQAARALQQDDGAMYGLAQITSRFPPPPATLLYVRSDTRSLAFAGTGNDASVQELRQQGLPGYGPLEDLPVPDFLTGTDPAIHLQATRLPPEPVAAPTPPAREPGT